MFQFIREQNEKKKHLWELEAELQEIDRVSQSLQKEQEEAIREEKFIEAAQLEEQLNEFAEKVGWNDLERTDSHSDPGHLNRNRWT